jgi:long-chain acyl-CoA synthetase
MNQPLTTLCDLVDRNAARWPDRISHRWKTPEGFQDRTWAAYRDEVGVLALGLEAFGVRGGSAALFADNRFDWAVTDQALLHLDCPSVPRGSDTAPREQKFLFLHSDARWLIVEGARNLAAFAAEFGPGDRRPEAVFLFDSPGAADPVPEDWRPLVKTYAEVRDRGRTLWAAEPDALVRLRSRVTPGSVASVIYTSGTSGNPKGVVLTHANFLHNVRAITPLLHIDPEAGETTVSVLPVWHVYERCFEFCMANGNMTLYYSSIRTLSEDLVREKPTIVASVPRVWESIYGKLQAKMAQETGAKQAVFGLFVRIARSRYRAGLALRGWRPRLEAHPLAWLGLPGHFLAWALLSPFNALAQKAFAPLRALLGGRLRASFSGGGSLPYPIDQFFNSIGIPLVNAYGMTESSPGSITRRIERNVPGSIGIPLDGVEIRIMKDDGTVARVGEKGLIHVRGANVMGGYYKNPQATAEVLSADGWLNTGDLGALSRSGDYVITGRAKSTIVLVGGENVEPEPIEEKLQESDLIEHAVVVGQDQKGLRAILTVNEDHLKKLGDRLKVRWDELWHPTRPTVEHRKVLDALGSEIKRLVNRENGFKPFEAITKFVVVKKKFEVGDELTQTLKVKRQVVEDKYGALLDEKDPKTGPPPKK